MAEFELIQRLSRSITTEGPGVSRSIGDDAALLEPRAGQTLVLATDTLNENIHFFPDADPQALGHKALAVNLSDLAAMGAQPRWALLNLTLPGNDEAWVDAFARGFAGLADAHGVALVGGDTCSGTRSVTVTAIGEVDPGQALCRDGASAGDLIYLSGTVGEAALALEQIKRGSEPEQALANALHRPQPEVALGRALRGIASACIDISDGLFADLGHIAAASGLGATVALEKLPAGSALASLAREKRWQLQLFGGEDYCLCFTVSPSAVGALEDAAARLGSRVSCIGSMHEGDAVTCLADDGSELLPEGASWDHFASEMPR